MTRLSDLFTRTETTDQRAVRLFPAFRAAKMGYTHQLDQHFSANPKTIDSDKAVLIKTFIDDPLSFGAKEKLMTYLVEKQFDQQLIFGHVDKPDFNLEYKLWNSGKHLGDTDLIKAKAILLAEFVRLHYCFKGHYNIPFDTLTNTQDVLEEETKASILALQHALVDYVAEKGPSLVLNRGAAMLHMARDEDVADIWARKIGALDIKNTYSLQKGDIRTIQPVFQ